MNKLKFYFRTKTIFLSGYFVVTMASGCGDINVTEKHNNPFAPNLLIVTDTSGSCPDRKFTNLQLAIDHKDCVEVLKLREEGFTKWPSEIASFKNLSFLDLGMNHIDSIPEDIDQLSNLTELNMCHGYLKHIPESIGKLKKLKRLVFIDNEIRSLPEGIGMLEALEVLILKGNKIKVLPRSIVNLKNLKQFCVLDVEGNTTLSKAEQRRVIKGLPNCEISF